MTSLEAASRIVEIPEGAIPEFGVTIVSYLDMDGETYFGFATHGDTNRSSLVGLMSMCSHKLIHFEDD